MGYLYFLRNIRQNIKMLIGLALLIIFLSLFPLIWMIASVGFLPGIYFDVAG